MADLHGKIMNLQLDPGYEGPHVPHMKLGHKEARHAAAELAAGYDSRISELEAANDAAERDAGLGDGNLWRFWSRKAQEVVALRSTRISELEAENARLRYALEPFANALVVYGEFPEHQLILLSEDNPKGRRLAHLLPEKFDAARAALGDSEGQS